MKNIYVQMPLTEEVLNSYLSRVFDGKEIIKNDYKIVFFPETNFYAKPAWTKNNFRDFCLSTLSIKRFFRIYKAEETK